MLGTSYTAVRPLISKQDTFVFAKPCSPLTLHFHNPLFNISHCQWHLPPAEGCIKLQMLGTEHGNMIERVTFLSSFGGLVGFLMHIGWNHYSFFHSRTSQGKLNRSEQVRTPDFCETRSKPSLLLSEAAAQLTDHLCWKN